MTNVILPKDIGVTYDMIGGLGGAKELLRQCITYPLRFPHLYNEGIAKEAVKGVLLFGPPGRNAASRFVVASSLVLMRRVLLCLVLTLLRPTASCCLSASRLVSS